MNPQKAQLKRSLESAVGVLAASTASVVVFSRRQLMRGSCTKASSMAITLSLLLRSTRTTFSHVNLRRDSKNCYVFESQSTAWPSQKSLPLLLRSTRTTFPQVNLHKDSQNVFESQPSEEVHMLKSYHESSMAHSPAWVS